jgi:hypothetical protein
MNNDLEKQYDAQFPEKDFKKSIFTFTNEEKAELGSFNTIMQMAQLAEILSNQIVNTKVLPRLGQKVTSDSQVYYDIPSGKIVTWIPKQICSECKMKKAEFEYKGKIYCKTCVDVVRAAEPVKAVVDTKKKKV